MANPNPSPETRFGGVRGPKNPGGKTKKQVKAERQAAHKAAILRDKMLSAIMEKLETGESALDYISGEVLKLCKDSEDRAHGTPTTTIAGDPDRPLLQTIDPSKLTMEQRKAILAALVTNEPEPDAG